MQLTTEDIGDRTEGEGSDICLKTNNSSKGEQQWVLTSVMEKEKDDIVEDNSVISAYKDRGGGTQLALKIPVTKMKDETVLKNRQNEVMDTLIKCVEDCHIKNGQTKDGGVRQVTQEVEEEELAGKMLKMTLKNVPATSESLTHKRQEPREDDERGDHSVEHTEEGLKNGTQYEPRQLRLVKLEEPTFDVPDSETGDKKTCVSTRSPLGGKPVHHHNLGNNGGQMFYNQNGTFWQQHMPPMPDNFPNYGNHHLTACPPPQYPNRQIQSDGIVGGQGHHKRVMEPQEMTMEAPKYVRPQQMPQNNLNDPRMPLSSANSGTPLSPTSFKPVNTVCTIQMSGGTVYEADTSDSAPLGNLASHMPPLPQQQLYQQQDYSIIGLHHQQQQQQQQVCGFPNNNNGVEESQFGSGFQALLEEVVNAEEDGRVNSEEFVQMLESAIAANQGQDDETIHKDLEDILPREHMIGKTNSDLAFLSNKQSPGYLPPSNTPPALNQFGQQQTCGYPNSPFNTGQPVSGYTDPMKIQPQKNRNSLEDMGYVADQSPSHESSQSSLSPFSVMEGSPASSGIGCSPPPPPSNISEMSLDSGINSPMSEDGRSNYAQTQLEDEYYEHKYVNDHLLDLNDALLVAKEDVGKSLPITNVQPQPHSQSFQRGSPSPVGSVAIPQQIQPISTVNAAAVNAIPVQGMNNISQKMLPIGTSVAVCVNSMMNNINSNLLTSIPAPIISNPINITNTISAPNNLTNTISAPNNLTNTISAPNNLTNTISAPVTITNTILGPNSLTNTITNPNDIVISNRVPTTTCPPLSLNQSSAGLVLTTASGVPLVNEQGKVAIPCITPRTRQVHGSTQVVPVLLSRNQAVLLLQQNQKPRYPNIAPKDSTKQNADSSGIGSCSNGGARASPGQLAGSHGNQSTTVGASKNLAAGQSCAKNNKSTNNRLHCARRLVANLERKDLEFNDAEGDTNLHVAVCRTDPFLIQALLERLLRERLHSMINAQNNAGQTPLYLAVSSNDPQKVKVLVDKGADVTLYAECNGYNGAREKKAAIHCAASKGHTYLETLNALLTAPGIQLEQPDSQGHTALHCAILCHGKSRGGNNNQQMNSLPVIEALVSRGANPNHQVQNGRTALMFALETGHLELFEKLHHLIELSEWEKSLKTQDTTGCSVLKMADRLKSTLNPADQQRLQICIKRNSYPRNGSGNV